MCRGTYPDDRVPGHGVRAGATFVIGPYLGVFARGESVRAQGQNHGTIFLGANASSYAAGGASALLVLLGMIAMASVTIE